MTDEGDEGPARDLARRGGTGEAPLMCGTSLKESSVSRGGFHFFWGRIFSEWTYILRSKRWLRFLVWVDCGCLVKRSRALLASNPMRDSQARAVERSAGLGAYLFPGPFSFPPSSSFLCSAHALKTHVGSGVNGDLRVRFVFHLAAGDCGLCFASCLQPSFAFAAASRHIPSWGTSARLAAAPAKGWTRIILFDRFANATPS